MRIIRYLLLLSLALPISASNDRFIAGTVNTFGEGVKVATKAGLCLYAAYLCFDHGRKAINYSLDFVKRMEIRHFLHDVSKPTKHILIVAGLALVAYECYRSLQHDMRWNRNN